VFLIGLAGEVDDRIKGRPHAIMKWGQFGLLQRIVAEHKAREIVNGRRDHQATDISSIAVDFGTLKMLRAF